MSLKDLKTPFFTVLFIFLGFILYTKLFGSIPFSVNSIQTTKDSLFRVDGTGKATAVPNTALLQLGVTQSGNTVLEAQNKTNTAANKITQDLKALGIEEKRIKTTNYSVNPDYRYSTDNSKPTITGYTVTQSIEVEVKPIDRANKAVDTATADGANMVGSIQFTIDDTTRKDLENKARDEAIKNAKEKAQQLAKSAGITLGRIIDVQESSNAIQPPILYKSEQLNAAPRDTAGEPTEFNPGESTIQLTVTLSYETR